MTAYNYHFRIWRPIAEVIYVLSISIISDDLQ